MKVGFLLGVLGQAQLLEHVVFEKQRILSHFVRYMRTLLLLHIRHSFHVATEAPAGSERSLAALAHQTRLVPACAFIMLTVQSSCRITKGAQERRVKLHCCDIAKREKMWKD